MSALARHLQGVFYWKAMVSQHRERRKARYHLHQEGGPEAGRAQAIGLFTQGCTHHVDWSYFWTQHHVWLLSNNHVLSLSSEHRYAGSTWASPWLQSLPVLLWEKQEAGRRVQISLSRGYNFTSYQSYFHLSRKGSALWHRESSLDAYYECEFMSLQFLKEKRNVKKANMMVVVSEGFVRQETISWPASGDHGCEQTVPSVARRPDRKGTRPPDGVRDNNDLSRHRYLLQQSVGTGQWTFSRESCRNSSEVCT